MVDAHHHAVVTNAICQEIDCVSVLLTCTQGHLDLTQALQAARLEEEFQIDRWGLVEGGHDVDQANAKVQLAAPSLFLRLLQTSR